MAMVFVAFVLLKEEHMVNISPLSLHLAQPEFAKQLASLPYDVFNEQEARA